MADITKAFDVEEGLSLKDEVLIISGSVDPSVAGEAAPQGSLFLRTTGSLFLKTGLADNQWYNVGSSISQHNLLSGLLADDHTQYMHNTTARTVTAQHTFNPVAASAPFILGANATGQLVTGLNADLLDGLHSTSFQAASTQLSTVSALATAGVVVRVSAASWIARTITGTAGRISVTNGSGTAGNPTIDLITTGVVAGTYNSLTVDTYGRVTAGTTQAYLTANQTITLSGSVTGSGTTSIVTTLSNTGVTAGTYNSVTVNAEGRVTTGTNPTTLAGYGITNGVSTSQLGAANGVATLDASGYLTSAQIPPLLITDTSVVASQAAMLALTAQTGDVAVRTDLNKTFILKGTDATVLANWQELLTPTASNLVTSVNGQTGAVVISTITGNASTATTLQTARTISLTSDVTGSVSFDGSSNVSITSTLSNTGVAAGTYGRVTVDAKGRVTAGAQETLDNLSDVTITSPINGQVVSYDGSSSQWINSNLVNGATSTLLSSWTLVSGNRYYADFAHNLASYNLVITLFDVANNSVVLADSIVLTNANTVRITVIGNTRTIRCVVIANGVSIAAGGSNPASMILKDEGVNVINTPHTSLNFTGNVVVSDGGTGIGVVHIPGSPVLRTLSFPATSFDSPNNADWVVNALAPVVLDPSNNAIPVRQFSNTVEQGIGLMLSIPSGATSITFKTRSKAAVAQAGITVVQPRMYTRLVPDNAAMGSWGAAVELTNITIPANSYYQYAEHTLPISSLGMVAGKLFQLEITRRVTGVTGTNLPANWLIAELTIEFL